MLWLAAGGSQVLAQVYLGQSGKVHFKSEAPLEIIEASSRKLKGAVDAGKKTFAFSVEMESFQGFNSPLQRTHFNENYMESAVFSTATFTGKIIEDIDFSKDGEHVVRAKGKLVIHGVEQERIIKSNVKIAGGKMTVTSNFTVLLEEHNISIPKIVYQKIAEEIAVDLEMDLEKRE